MAEEEVGHVRICDIGTLSTKCEKCSIHAVSVQYCCPPNHETFGQDVWHIALSAEELASLSPEPSMKAEQLVALGCFGFVAVTLGEFLCFFRGSADLLIIRLLQIIGTTSCD